MWLVLLLPHAGAFAQHYNFRQLTINDGLPGMRIYRTFTDSKGYVWFLSDRGIMRTDGTQLKYFSTRDGFGDMGAYHIAEDTAGIMWFISINFELYYFKDERFHKVTSPPVIWVDTDKNGERWVVLRNENHYIYRINRQFTLEKYAYVPEMDNNCAIQKTATGFLVTTISYVLEFIPGQPVHVLQHLKVYDTNIVPRLFLRKNGKVLINTEHGLHEFDPVTHRQRKLMDFGRNEIFCLLEDSLNGAAWIGTLRGAYMFPGGNIREDNRQVYLSDVSVNCIGRPSGHVLIFGTGNAGAFLCNFNAQHITRQENLLPEQVNYCVNKPEGIYMFNLNGAIHLHRDGNTELLAMHTDKVIDVVNNDDCIYLYSPRPAIVYNRQLVPIPSEYVRSSYIRRDGAFFQSGKTGILRYKCPRSYTQLLDTAQYNFITREVLHRHPTEVVLVYAAPGRFIFTVPDGITEVLRSGNRMRQRHYRYEGHLSNICMLGNKVLLSTFENGLYIYDGANVRHHTHQGLLLSDHCISATQHEGYTWLLTDKGVMRFKVGNDLNLYGISNFTSDNYLVNNDVKDITFRGAYAYVGTNGGLSIFRSDRVSHTAPPALHIEQVQINNADTTVSSSYVLPYARNNISVALSSTGGYPVKSVLFKYVIRGMNNDTVYTPSNMIRFSSLAPGNYELFFWVKNSEGVWSYTAERMSVTILPPFWKSWWFITAIVLFILAVAGCIIFILIRSIQRENRYRHKLVQSELRALHLYINPHFIFNTLNSLYMLILKNDKEQASTYVLSFSRLIRLIMNYSSRTSISLAEEQELLVMYIRLEQKRFREEFHFTIMMENNIPLESTHIPPLIIQPFVENAIKHGLSGKDNGVLSIRFALRGPFLECIIDDNGLGREIVKKKQLSVVNKEDSTGIRYIEDRLKLLVNQPGFEPVVIRDKYENGQASGTEVTLLIPLI